MAFLLDHAADALVDTGLAELGYRYVNIGDLLFNLQPNPCFDQLMIHPKLMLWFFVVLGGGAFVFSWNQMIAGENSTGTLR